MTKLMNVSFCIAILVMVSMMIAGCTDNGGAISGNTSIEPTPVISEPVATNVVTPVFTEIPIAPISDESGILPNTT